METNFDWLELDGDMGDAGLPGTGFTAGEKADMLADIAEIQAIAASIPDSIDDFPDVDLTGIATNQLLRWDGAKLVPYTLAQTTTVSKQLFIDGGGSAITAGAKGFFYVEVASTITGWQLAADQAGNCLINIWRDTFANHPPTSADIISPAGAPYLDAMARNSGTDMTGWTTSVPAGSMIRVNVQSASTITMLMVSLVMTRAL